MELCSAEFKQVANTVSESRMWRMACGEAKRADMGKRCFAGVSRGSRWRWEFSSNWLMEIYMFSMGSGDGDWDGD
jgi:hypothetical protein